MRVLDSRHLHDLNGVFSGRSRGQLSRRALQLVHAGERLARPAMRHDAGEPLVALVEGDELLARFVDDRVAFGADSDDVCLV